MVLAGASNAGFCRPASSRARDHRQKALADVSRYAEIAEYYPGYDLTIWLGLFAPPATPEPIVTKLRNEVQRA